MNIMIIEVLLQNIVNTGRASSSANVKNNYHVPGLLTIVNKLERRPFPAKAISRLIVCNIISKWNFIILI